MTNKGLNSILRLVKKIISLVSRKIVLAIILIISLAGILGGFLFYNNYQKQKNTAGGEAEIGSLTKSVGKLIELPTNETPQLATVSDITKLKDQAFFAKAQNGDKVLIFIKAKKAIIYRPSINRIIEVAFYTPPAAQASPSASATPAPKIVRIALYNGTTIVGYTKTIGGRLSEKFANIEVITRENASKSDYQKTVVIDLTNNKEMASAIASELKGEVGSLPEGESKPNNTDILVILGSSK